MTGADERPWTADLTRLDLLVATGVPRQTIRRRVRRGRWREPLPGVVCRTDGQLTADQWRVAALLHGGDGSALSHASAGEFWASAERTALCTSRSSTVVTSAPPQTLWCINPAGLTNR